MPTSSLPASDSQASVFEILGTPYEDNRTILHGVQKRRQDTSCCASGRTRNRRSSGTSALKSRVHGRQPALRSFAKDVILAQGGWTEALGLRQAMIDYFVNNRAGYAFPRAVSIFRNLAWRLLIPEMWSSAQQVAPDVG
jgi:hypothetical protein